MMSMFARKDPNDSAPNRRKTANRWTGARNTDNRRGHDGPCRWGPVIAGGGALGQLQVRECQITDRCRRWQSRPYPKPGLRGRAIVPRWTTHNAPRGWWR